MALRISRKFVPWVGHHAVEFKWFYLGAFLCLFVLQKLQAELPERIRGLMVLMGDGRLGEASVWVFLGLAVGILIFRTFSRLLFFYPARVQQKLLRMELLELIENVPPDRYAGRSQGQLFQILFDDINNLRAFIGFGLLQIGNLIIAAWVLIPKVNHTDEYLWPAFIPLFSSVLLFTIMTFFNQKFFKKQMDKKGEVQQFIIESYEAKQTIKNFHREENFVSAFVKTSGEELSYFFKSSIGFAITGPYVRLGLGASLLWGGHLIRLHGGKPADLVFFSGFLYLFLEPVMFLSWVAVVISQGFAAWKRVKEMYAELTTVSAVEEETRTLTIDQSADHMSTSISFWGKPISLSFSLRRWTVITGETGAGKSYILNKLATILILKGEKVSMVQQEPYLFNDTIEGNIFLGRAVTPADEKRASELLEMFQLEGLAPTMREVLKMEVGENGKRLSGGQMKRVALIRSLLSGAEVLIWDDPFSSVDVILERRIVEALRIDSEFARKTIILSSHRLTTVRLSDEMLMIEKQTGMTARGPVAQVLKETHVHQFFKEQFLEASLA